MTMHDRTNDATAHERAVRRAAEDWVTRRASGPGRIVSSVSNLATAAVGPVLAAPRVQRAVQSASERVLQRVDVDSRVDDIHQDRLRALDDDPEAQLELAAGRVEEIRRRNRLVLGAQSGITGAASATPITAVAAFAGDLVALSTGLVHVAAAVLASYGVTGDRLLEMAVDTVGLATERDEQARRSGLRRLVETDPVATSSPVEVMAGQAGPRAAGDAIEAVVRRFVGRRAVAAAPLVGAAIGAASTAWMVDAVVDAASHVGALRLVAGPRGQVTP